MDEPAREARTGDRVRLTLRAVAGAPMTAATWAVAATVAALAIAVSVSAVRGYRR